MQLVGHALPQVRNHISPQLPRKSETVMEVKKILVIDDDADVCFGLQARLKANSYDTCFADDAKSAISTALRELPNLIILDLGLPGDDGYAVMKLLTAYPEVAAVPIIVVTGRDRYTHEALVYAAGAKQFFQKPFDDNRLLMAIRQLLA